MAFDTSSGTRGARTLGSSGKLSAWLRHRIAKRHRRKGYRFMGADILFLITVGRSSGQLRETPLLSFPDGEDAWLVVASAGGTAHSPDWYLNLAAHPDQLSIELAGNRNIPVTAEQLVGERREDAWQRLIEVQPRYAKYQQKTDRVLPVIRLAARTAQ